MANRSSPPLVRETAAAFACRPGAALLLAQVAFPEVLQIQTKELGTVKLRLVGLEPRAISDLLTDVRETCEHFSLPTLGPGLLLVERRFARYLLSLLLRSSVSLGGTSLSRIERGVIGGFLAGALAKVGLGLVQLSLTRTEDVATEAVALAVRAEAGDEAGQVWLCATPSAMAACCQSAVRSTGETLPALRLELARTSVPKSEALALSEGDVVVFDETAALSSSSDWPLHLHCRGRRVCAILARDGRVSAAEPTAARPTLAVDQGPSTRNAGDVAMSAEIAHAAASGSLHGSENENAGSARGDGILLRTDDVDWAEGDLCEVADKLAVRIRRMLSR